MSEELGSYEDVFLKKQDRAEGIKNKASPLKINGRITLWSTDSDNGYAREVKDELRGATTKINANVLNHVGSFRVNRLYMNLGNYMFEAELVPAKDVISEYSKQVATLMQGLFGDIQPSLELCVDLVGGDHFKFGDLGFDDPTCIGNWRGKETMDNVYGTTEEGVLRLVRWAQNYQAFTLPELTERAEDIQIEFIPTFQTLRSIDKNLFHPEYYEHTIRGKTFADCVDNFCTMYEKVVDFTQWTQQEVAKLKAQGVKNPIPKVARLILPD